MKHRRKPLPGFRSVVTLVCLVALVSSGVLAAKPTTTIVGTVKAAEKYNGKVTAVYIDDPEAGKFLVARSTDIGKELKSMIGTRIRATGYVKKPRPGSDSGFELVIDIVSYEAEPDAT